VIRTPSFQKYSGRLAASYLSEKFQTKVLLEKIRISDWLRVELQNLSIEDRLGNTLLKVDKLEAGIQKLIPRERTLSFQYLSLTDGIFSMVKYKSDSIFNLAQILQPVIKTGPRDSITQLPWEFRCHKLQMEGMDFILRNENRMQPKTGIDYHDMEISGIRLLADKVSVISDSVSADIKWLSAQEKSGVNLKRFIGNASISGHQIKVEGLETELNGSSVNLDLEFSYRGYVAFKDFINQVNIHSEVRHCNLNLRDIGYFAPAMFAMDNLISFKGDVQGTVNDFNINRCAFNVGYHTHFDGDISMSGLPDIYTTKAILDIRKLEVSPGDVGNFALPGEVTYISLPEWMEQLGIMTLTGKYAGVYDDFDLNASISTILGDVTLDVHLDYPEGIEVPVYSGDVRGENIALGRLINYSDLGTFDIDAEIQGAGLQKEDLEAFANVWIENLYYKGHHYDRVVMGGDFTVNTFFGRCLVFDESLELSFEGLLDFSQEHPVLRFHSELEKARFSEMNLSDRATDMDLKGKLFADFTGIDPDSFTGNITMDSLVYVENDQTYVLNHLELNRNRDSLFGDVIRLRSDYADADASGSFSVRFLLPQVRDLVMSWRSDQGRDTSLWEQPQQIRFDIYLKNTEAVTGLFLDDLALSEDVHINGKFNSDDEELDVSGSMGFISYKDIRLEDIDFESYSITTGLHLQSHAKNLFFNKSSGSDTLNKLGIEQLDIQLTSYHDSIDCAASWDDFKEVDYNSGFIKGFIKIPEQGHIEAAVTSTNAIVNGEYWRIEPGNYLVVDTNFIEFTDLTLKGSREEFHIDGRISTQTEDTLRLSFDNWALDNFSPIINRYFIQLDGRLDGNIGFTYQEDAPTVFSNLSVDSLELNNTMLGKAGIRSNWINDNQSLVVSMQILPFGGNEKYKVLNLSGFVYPMDSLNNFDLDIVTQNLQLSVLAPFMRSFSSGLKGLASGQLYMGGTFKEPILTGDMKVQRTEIKIDFLNVTYTLSNELVFKENTITFNDIEIYDQYTNRAVCSGTLRHDHFRNMYLDLLIQPENLLAMNLSRYDNDLFYGTAYTSGDIRVYGPFKDISLDLDVNTEEGTNVYIPISQSVDVSQSDFIIFSDSGDSTTIQDDYRVVVQGLKLNMGIGVEPTTNLQIFLPSNMGSIRTSGEGKLQLGVDPRGYLTINGSYIITSGLFTFSLEQLLSKRFEILRGSSIKWRGSLYDAEVNIKANFRTKTSLNGLGITMLDPSSLSKKMNVLVKIFMTDNLVNPNLRFSIEFPNMDEQIRQTIYAVLDTTDMAMMNQQAISLLILNSFTYTGDTGSNPVNSTAIIANTLSSMLSSISNDFDIGINYIPGDAVSSEEVEVALSTQLFDDRLSIDGNVGVSTGRNTQSTSSIVGEVQVEYMLTPDGKFRVKAFNRSNDISIINNDVPYTQGVGIFYRKDFNNLRELFSSGKREKKNPKK
jgi:hypothetical protein